MERVRLSAKAAALVTLALGLPAFAQEVQSPASIIAGPPGQEVEIEADRAVYAWDKRLLKLEGHVVARRGEGVLRAASGVLDRNADMMTLSGGVLGVQGRQVFLADGAVVNLDSNSADLQSAVLYLKEKPADPSKPAAGKNSLILHGARVKQLQGQNLLADDVTLTPCDCAGEPDYELLARQAHIDEDRAHLRGTRLRLGAVTLPLFPLSLPLTSRQSGLLAPQLGFAPMFGFAYSQPVFLTLGQSNDLTLAPGFYTGLAHTYLPTLGNRTIRGPRLGAEWRYAPAEGTSGSISLDLFYDLDKNDSRYHDPNDPGAVVVPPSFPGERGTDPGRGFGGVRGIAHVNHRSEGALGTFAVQGAAATDSMVLSDSQPFSLESYLDLLRTDVGAWRSDGAWTAGADATLLQDVRDRFRGDYPDRRLFGPERRTTFQRLPALFAQLAATPLGPVTFSAEASAAQFAPFAGPDAEEQSTGFAPTDRNAGAAAPLGIGNVARAPALRVDASPRLALALPADFPVDLRLEAGARADAWLTEGFSDRNRARLYALAGVHAGLPLERRFGSMLHRLEPAFEVRGLSKWLQTGGAPIGDPADGGGATYLAVPDSAEQGLAPGIARREAPCLPGGPCATTHGVPALRRPYDEIDGAAPSTGAVEATMALSQSLWTKVGSGAVRLLRLDLLQDALLAAPGTSARLGEATASLSAALGPANLSGVLRYDWSLRAVSFLNGGVSVRDARTDEAHAGVTVLKGTSSERLRSGIDELFSAVLLASAAGDLSGTYSLGASAPLPLGLERLRLSYDLIRFIVAGALPVDAPDSIHSLRLGYETTCHCAAVSLGASIPVRDGSILRTPSFYFVLDLKALGSFGATTY